MITTKKPVDTMLNIYILRTSGNKDGTWGKLWTDGHPTFRCKT